MFTVLLLAVAVFVAIGIVWLLHRMEKKRQARWQAFAAHHGWRYTRGHNRELARNFGFLNRLDRGRSRYATDVIEGSLHGQYFYAFTHHYEIRRGTGEDRRTTHYWHAVLAVTVTTANFPEVTIAPENVFTRIGNMFTGSDIDFESIEFSQSYHVKSRDRRLAYDICNPAMMEYLLTARGSIVEIEGRWLATIVEGKLTLDDIPGRIAHLENIVNRLPRLRFNPWPQQQGR